MGDPLDDGSLLEACQQGDREALRALFEAHRDRVYSLALHFMGDRTAAEDITQSVFLKLFGGAGRFRGDARPGTWLYRLVANACIDEHRRRRRLVPIAAASDRLLPASDRPQEESLASEETGEAVRAAVVRLPPKLRLPILMRYLEGLSYGEIAAALGCSKGTVASRLNRGHRELARRLESLRDPRI
jgi:RNA polymerase sigma-70 factor, ECF subfamily